MELSKRLQAAADFVTPGVISADIGCDHGFLSIYLVERRICPKIIAMDVNRGPLSRAEEHIKRHGFCAYIETRLSDGLECLRPGEAEALLCAGMGGRLMIRILSEGMEKTAAMEELILQPQSEIKSVRKFLRNSGFYVTAEAMVFEEEKYYPVMRAVPVRNKLDKPAWNEEEQELFDEWGEHLLKGKNPVLKGYILYKQKEWSGVLDSLAGCNAVTARNSLRADEIKSRIKAADRALACYF